TVRRNASTSASSAAPPCSAMTSPSASPTNRTSSRSARGTCCTAASRGLRSLMSGSAGIAMQWRPYRRTLLRRSAVAHVYASSRWAVPPTLAPVITSALPATVGVVGLGRFGRLWASTLQDDFTLRTYDSDPTERASAESLGLTTSSLPDTLASEAVFYCVPISEFEATFKQHV